MEYNFSKLWSAQFFGFYQFKSFYEYASDIDAQREYYKRAGAIHCDANGKLTEVKTPEPLIDYKIEENESTLEMIKNQLIVFLFTRYEFIIQETVICLMCDNSNRILDFIKVYPDYKDAIGFSLTEFLKHESKEDYIAVISQRLGHKILSGKPSKVINRLKCLISFESIDTAVLDDLMIKRNNIVHEGKVYEIGLNQLEVFYEAIEDLLKTLALALKEINITVVDIGELLM